MAPRWIGMTVSLSLALGAASPGAHLSASASDPARQQSAVPPTTEVRAQLEALICEQNARESWSLSFHLSGGFAGVDRELDLASTGELQARDRKRGTQATAQAPASDLVQIAALVAAVKSVDSGRPTACRDCLQYDVEVYVRGQVLVLHLHDMTVAGSGTERLVKALRSMLDRALAGRLSSKGPPG